ncbi:cadherin domain-containing protein [Litorivicinus sp.]|nr:cadherin domain-containing protein [Litorivicinus sp.]
MPLAVKSLVIIIDSFSDRIFSEIDFDNLHLFDFGLNYDITYFDHNIDPYSGMVTGYGEDNYDYYEINSGPLIGFHEVEYNSATTDLVAESFIASSEFTDTFYETAYAHQYEYLLRTDQKDSAPVNHGDWVLNSFLEQLDSPEQTEVICIDVDELSDRQYSTFEHGDSEAHWTKLFDNVQTNVPGASGQVPALIDVIERFYLENDQRFTGNASDDFYLPVGISASIAGAGASSDEKNTFGFLEASRSLIIQSAPNVGKGDYDWGSNYPDVINVGAWNEDSEFKTLISSETTQSTVDLVANGYIYRSGWDTGVLPDGWNFGTSFATPRVTSEITNFFNFYIDHVNQNDLGIDALDFSGIDYNDLVNEIVDTVTTDIRVLWSSPGQFSSFTTEKLLTDDYLNHGLDPVYVPYPGGHTTSVTDVRLAYSAPVFSSSTTGSIIENSAIATVIYDADASDADGDTLAYSISGTDNSFLNINSSTGEVTLNSTANFEEKSAYNFVVSVTDGPNSLSQSVRVDVEDGNDPAIFQNYRLTSSPHIVGDVLTASINYDDEDGVTGADPTYSWYSKSDNSLTLKTTGGNSYTIQPNDVGNQIGFSVSFEDDKGYLEISDRGFLPNVFVIASNTKPVLTSGTAVSADENISIQKIVYAVTATDADADDLVFSLSLFDSANFQINSATGSVTFKESPNYEDQSSYRFVVNASDGQLTASQEVTVSINDRDDLTVFSNPRLTGNLIPYEEIDVSIDIFDEDGVSQYEPSVYWYLDDGNPLTRNTHLDGHSPNDGLLTLRTEWADHTLLYRFSFSDDAQNSSLSDFYEAGFIEALPDYPPVFSSPTTKSVFENIGTETIVYQTIASDPEGNAVTFSLAGPDASSFNLNSSSGVLKIRSSPNYEDQSSYQLEIMASDGVHDTTQQLLINVLNINEGGPVISSNGAGSIAENSSIDVVVLDVDASDIDGDAIVYWISGGDASNFMIDQFSGEIRFKTVADYESKNVYSFDVHVREKYAGSKEPSDTQSISISVTDLNEGPVILGSGSLTIAENVSVPVYLGTVSAFDPDTDSLTYRLFGTDSDHISISDSGELYLDQVPNFEAQSVYNFDVGVSDGVLESEKSYELSVSDINDAPGFLSVASTYRIDEDALFQTNLSVTDEDNDPLSFSTVNLPDWLIFNASDLSLSGTPENDDIGIYRFNIIVQDPSSETDELSLKVVVSNTNDAPIFSSTPDANIQEGSEYQYQVLVNDDDPGDSVSLTATELPDWLRFDSSTNRLEGIPGNSDVGQHDITLVAVDQQGVITEQRFQVTVDNVNQAPIFSSVPVTTVVQDSVYAYQLAVYDEDLNDELTIEFENLPAWMSYDSSTMLLSGVPSNSDVGSYQLSFLVRDYAGASTRQDFSIKVANKNDAPVIGSANNVSVNENTETNESFYTVTATDIDGDELHFSIAGPDAGKILIDSVSGDLFFQSSPNYEEDADYQFTVSVTDGDLTDSQLIRTQINDVNDAPVFFSLPKTEIFEDDEYVYELFAMDEDALDTVSYHLEESPDWLTLRSQDGTDWLGGVPENGDVGVHVVRVRAEDSFGESVTQSYQINVTNTNDAPLFLERVYTRPEQRYALSESFEKFLPGARIFLESGEVLSGFDVSDDLQKWLTIGGQITGVELVDHSLVERSINITDAVLQLKHIVGLEDLSGESRIAADTNGDGAVNISDAVMNLKHIVGLDPTYAVEFIDSMGQKITDLADLVSVGSDYFSVSSEAIEAAFSASDFLSFEALSSDHDIRVIYRGDVDRSARFIESRADLVDENIEIDQVMFSASAIDVDAGDSVSFRLVGPDAESFALEDTVGNDGEAIASIRLRDVPNYEDQTSYSFGLVARDKSGSETQEIFFIEVVDLNDAPVFVSDALATIPENNESGSFVYQPVFFDEDGDVLSVSLGGDDQERFFIDPISHEVRLLETADYELKSSYSLIVLATDGVDEIRQAITVSVEDVNEAPVLLSELALFVPENTAINSMVISLTASDPDDDVLIYSMSGADSSLFQLNADTGDIHFLVSPDYETQANYQLSVGVSDGEYWDYRNLDIAVSDVNDAPVIMSDNLVSHLEGLSTEATAYQILGTDPDNDSLTFSMSGTDSELLRIDSGTGAVRFKASPLYLEQSTYSFDAIVSDAEFSTTQAVTIEILEDFLLTILSERTVTIDENTDASLIIYQPTTNFPPNLVTYSIDGLDVAYFSIDANTGEIQLKESANYEAKQILEFALTARSDNEWVTKDITVFVNNLNEFAPVISSDGTGSVYEQKPVSTIIYDINAQDSDGDSLSYSVVGTDAALLDVDPETGKVTLKSPADFSSKTSYQFTGVVTDGDFSDQQAIVVQVLNVNDGPIIDSGSTGSVNENADPATVIYNASATDADGDSITYAISGSDLAFVSIDDVTGEVTLLASADFEAKSTYRFDVTASDGQTSYIKSVLVSVINVNEAPVISSGNTGHIGENEALSTVVYTAAASDVDGDAVSYSLSGTDAALLVIDELSGDMTLNSSADYETKSQYLVNVVASDGQLSTSQPVTIDVWNVNEFTPVFSSGDSGSVTEYVPITTVIYDADATDADGDTVRYSISGTDSGLLSIDGASGKVTPLFVPDYDKKTQYEFSVIASDGYRTSTKAVSISVIDIEGGRPVVGTSGDDILLGTYSTDSFTTGAGSDVIYAFNGDDTITVDGVGDKTIDGGTGTDTLIINYTGVSSLSDFVMGLVPSAEGSDWAITSSTDDVIAFKNIIDYHGSTGKWDGYLTVGSTTYRFVSDMRSDRSPFDGGYGSVEAFVSQSGSDVEVVLPETGKWMPIYQNDFGGDHFYKGFSLDGSETYTIFGSTGAEVIFGGYQADTISAGAGDDFINGGDGADTIAAGDGDDVVYTSLAGLTEDVSIDGGSGSNTLVFSAPTNLWDYESYGSVTFDLSSDLGNASNFQNIGGSSSNDSLTGDGQANVIIGGSGDDTLYGGDGDDSLYGDEHTEDSGGWAYGIRQYNVIQGDDMLYGGAGNDRLVGSDGADTLDGGQGSDTLIGDVVSSEEWDSGYTGSDTFVLRAGDGGETVQLADTIIDFQDGIDIFGLDAGLQYTDLTLGQGSGDYASHSLISITATNEYLAVVENISVSNLNYYDFSSMAAGDQTLNGTSGNDVLLGAFGADTVTTGTGTDVVLTYAGDDTITVDGVGDKTIDGGTGTDTLIINYTGVSSLSDFVMGLVPSAEGSDWAMTSSTDDVIAFKNIIDYHGSTGKWDGYLTVGSTTYRFVSDMRSDRSPFDGGYGSVEAFVSQSGSDVEVVLPETGKWMPIYQNDFGGDHFYKGFSLDGSETYTIFGSTGAEVIFGGYQADTISAGAGDDFINGGDGADTIAAGDGDDVVYTSLAGLTEDVSIDGGSGSNTLVFSAPTNLWDYESYGSVTFDLSSDLGNASNFQNIGGSSSNDSLTGDGQANVIIGGSGDDTLYGGDGDDSLYGDEHTEDSGGWAYGIRQYNVIQGDDMLYGGAGNDRLVGSDGADTLDGGQGSDTLIGDVVSSEEWDSGYTGSDTFVLRAGDGGETVQLADTIIDFQDGIDIFGLDAGLQYTDLTLGQGSGDYASHSLISITATNEYLAVVENTLVDNLTAFDFVEIV